ncbi:HEPN domain-containing protein [Hymenobacter sp. IS2118]|uniref:HEPN domain-containing protein n=1 Tax=Hymenobacter sp. IS2118 TaxID=1505605 RepID=UPI00054D646F|nr:HEPN domain-containing protein [Hymenobacter sp. IS2118]
MSLLTADRDMEAAETLLKASPHLYESIGFHCQQATEKYIKAVLVASSLPAPFIHDLTKLLLPLIQANLIQFSQQDLVEATILNEFGVELRYETDDAPGYTSADLLTMATRFQTKLRPLAQAFLI